MARSFLYLAFVRAVGLSAATLDEHEDDTMREHQFVNVLSPSCSLEVA